VKFDKVTLSYGFVVNDADKCIYSKSDNSDYVIICLYVDDMLIFGSNISCVNEIKKFLPSKFDMKDLTEADVILGIKIIRKKRELLLTQSHYIGMFFKKYSRYNDEPAPTPLDSSIKLIKNTWHSISQLEYFNVIGSLMYAMHCIRPDIVHAISVLCRFTSNLGYEHWKLFPEF